jgi:hypothetical protein
MKKLLCGLAVLPFLSATALAQPDVRMSGSLAQQPLLLNEAQMDGVTAGWSLRETDFSNTSLTFVQVYGAPLAECAACYLDLDSRALQVDSIILGGP